jgi:peptidyl-tRNA hydrolase
VTQDISSSATGSSVFDFQGDGANEVIYNDECFLHIYDGRTGSEQLMEGPRPNSTRTRHEYPVVADVDLDGNSEIIVTSNRDEYIRDKCPEKWRAHFGVATDADLPEWVRTGTSGVWVFGDPKDRWVRTRPIWNQYSYHVTNISRDGVVPKKEEDNWKVDGLNDYRTNVQGAIALNAPNLVAKLTSTARCATSEVILSAVIVNAGARGVPPGVLVEFLQTAPGAEKNVGTVMTQRPLLPGGSERVTVTVKNIPFDVQLDFLVRVDGLTSTKPVAECKEDDNSAMTNAMCRIIM